MTTLVSWAAELKVNLLLGDPTKAKKVLGWTPTCDFEELVGMMVEHDMAVV